jgi:hypothetical protein
LLYYHDAHTPGRAAAALFRVGTIPLRSLAPMSTGAWYPGRNGM